jgi:uncharacterized LabA/DUF88 family protein
VWPQLRLGLILNSSVYVDGFNLYYGILRRTRFKWLDLEKLCHLVLKNTHIGKIKYFTARVIARPNDPDQAIRQEIYLRALATNPKIEIHFGHFLSHTVKMPVCDQAGQLTGQYAQVLKTEEKGSDVNIAAHLLLDAHQGQFDQAIVISNDSDLLTPIRLVRKYFGKRVGVLNPHKRPSQVLLREADFLRPIRMGAVSAAQFPDKMSDKNGNLIDLRNGNNFLS